MQMVNQIVGRGLNHIISRNGWITRIFIFCAKMKKNHIDSELSLFPCILFYENKKALQRPRSKKHHLPLVFRLCIIYCPQWSRRAHHKKSPWKQEITIHTFLNSSGDIKWLLYFLKNKVQDCRILFFSLKIKLQTFPFVFSRGKYGWMVVPFILIEDVDLSVSTWILGFQHNPRWLTLKMTLIWLLLFA